MLNHACGRGHETWAGMHKIEIFYDLQPTSVATSPFVLLDLLPFSPFEAHTKSSIN